MRQRWKDNERGEGSKGGSEREREWGGVGGSEREGVREGGSERVRGSGSGGGGSEREREWWGRE